MVIQVHVSTRLATATHFAFVFGVALTSALLWLYPIFGHRSASVGIIILAFSSPMLSLSFIFGHCLASVGIITLAFSWPALSIGFVFGHFSASVEAIGLGFSLPALSNPLAFSLVISWLVSRSLPWGSFYQCSP